MYRFEVYITKNCGNVRVLLPPLRKLESHVFRGTLKGVLLEALASDSLPGTQPLSHTQHTREESAMTRWLDALQVRLGFATLVRVCNAIRAETIGLSIP